MASKAIVLGLNPIHKDTNQKGPMSLALIELQLNRK